MPNKNIAKRREASRRHYQKHPEIYKRHARKWTKANAAATKKLILEYLSAHPCIECGESDPIVLEFDHRDRSKKKFDISWAKRGSYSRAVLLAEIAKCDVRCANCHRRKTFRERLELGELLMAIKKEQQVDDHPLLFDL